MDRQDSSCCKPSHIKDFIIHVHEFTHLPPLSQSFSLQTGNFLPCIPEFYDQSLESGIIKRSVDVYEFNKLLNSFTLTEKVYSKKHLETKPRARV